MLIGRQIAFMPYAFRANDTGRSDLPNVELEDVGLGLSKRH